MRKSLPNPLQKLLKQGLEQNKIQTESAEIAMVPISTVAIPDDKVASFEKLIDTLENNEDVQAVYHNAE